MGRKEEDHRESEQRKLFARNINGILITSQFLRRATMPPGEAKDLSISNILLHKPWRPLEPDEEIPEALKEFVDKTNNRVPERFFGPSPSTSKKSPNTPISQQNLNGHIT